MPEHVIVGRGGALSLGAQGTHASAAASSIDLPIISATVTRDVTWTPRPHLSAGTAGHRRYRVKTRERYPVKTVQELMYTGLGLLLRAALGDAATTGSGPYTHTFTLAATLPMLTAIVHDGTPSGGSISAYKSTVDSCVVSSLRLTGREGDIVRCEADMVGRLEARATTTPPTVAMPNPVIAHQGSTLAWNSTTPKIHDFDLVLDNGLEGERRAIGSLYVSRPIVGAHRVARLTVTMDVTDDAEVTALRAGTQGDAVLTFTGTSQSMTITLHNAQIVEEGTPVDTFGSLKRRVVFEAAADGTDQGLSIVIVNAESSALA